MKVTFPKGFLEFADRFKTDLDFYVVHFINPKSKRSLSIFAYLDDRWVVFPSAWTAFERYQEVKLASLFSIMVSLERYEDAYQFCASRLQERMTFEDFRDFAANLPLSNVERSSGITQVESVPTANNLSFSAALQFTRMEFMETSKFDLSRKERTFEYSNIKSQATLGSIPNTLWYQTMKNRESSKLVSPLKLV